MHQPDIRQTEAARIIYIATDSKGGQARRARAETRARSCKLPWAAALGRVHGEHTGLRSGILRLSAKGKEVASTIEQQLGQTLQIQQRFCAKVGDTRDTRAQAEAIGLQCTWAGSERLRVLGVLLRIIAGGGS